MAVRSADSTGSRLTRRDFAAAVVGLPIVPPVLIQAQSEQKTADETFGLVPNLFTRIGAAIRINGQGPFVFVIDTGAGRTTIADTVAQALRLPAGPPVLIHGVTAAEVTPSAFIDRLTLAGVGFSGLNAPVLSRELLGADGLIGLDVLGRFRLAIDVGRRKATLDPGGFRIVQSGGEGTVRTGSNIRRDAFRSARSRFGQLILTDTQAETVPVAAFIDSGAQYSIGNTALLRSVAARRPGVGLRPPITVMGVTGQSLSATPGRLDDLELGRSRLGPTPLLFADLHCFDSLGLADAPALLVGADLIGRFRRIQIDFPRNAISFEGLSRPRSEGRL